MTKIYKRNCNYCGKYYEGYGKSFCSIKCASMSSPKGFKKGQKAKNWNGFKEGISSWSKGINGKDFLKHFKEGKTWNKGFTKETDARVRKNAENLNKTLKKHPEIRKNAGKKISKTRKRLFKEGKLVVSEKNKKQARELGLKPKSEDHKRKIGESNKITKQKPEVKEKARIANLGEKNPFFGKTHTKETIRKMKENRPDTSGENNGMYGKHQTESSKRKYKEWRKTFVCPKKDTSIEVKIQNFLKELKIEFFTHKYIKIKHGYQCDILVPSKSLVIECDGDYWHNYPEGLEKDHIRTKELSQKGFKVLRLWENEIKVMELNDFERKLK